MAVECDRTPQTAECNRITSDLTPSSGVVAYLVEHWSCELSGRHLSERRHVAVGKFSHPCASDMKQIIYYWPKSGSDLWLGKRGCILKARLGERVGVEKGVQDTEAKGLEGVGN